MKMNIFAFSIIFSLFINPLFFAGDTDNDTYNTIAEVWFCYVSYMQHKPCNELRLDDFYIDFPKYKEVRNKDTINKLLFLTKRQL